MAIIDPFQTLWMQDARCTVSPDEFMCTLSINEERVWVACFKSKKAPSSRVLSYCNRLARKRYHFYLILWQNGSVCWKRSCQTGIRLLPPHISRSQVKRVVESTQWWWRLVPAKQWYVPLILISVVVGSFGIPAGWRALYGSERAGPDEWETWTSLKVIFIWNSGSLCCVCSFLVGESDFNFIVIFCVMPEAVRMMRLNRMFWLIVCGLYAVVELCLTPSNAHIVVKSVLKNLSTIINNNTFKDSTKVELMMLEKVFGLQGCCLESRYYSR